MQAAPSRRKYLNQHRYICSIGRLHRWEAPPISGIIMIMLLRLTLLSGGQRGDTAGCFLHERSWSC